MKKVAVITGASKGIGLACAQLFLKKGFTVINASRTNAHPIRNASYFFYATDVSKESEVRKLFSYTQEKFGRIDVLINNAGFGIFDYLADSKTRDFDSMFAVNVKGVYLCSRYALKLMIPAKRGTIINISSIAGKNGIETASVYCATKHAVMGLSKSLMAEVRKHGIRVIAVCPGSVDTHFFDHPSSKLSSRRDTILSPVEVAQICWVACALPQRAMVNEIEMRPLNPQK